MIHFINSLDPGMALALGVLLGGAVTVIFVGLGMAWDVTRPGSQEPRESATDRLERLDREAPKSRPTSSNRKAGRTGVQG